MMATKWTAGPWTYVEPEMLSHDAPGFTHKLSSGGIIGGTVDEPSWVIADADYIESEADIHLIAAAPELYEALRIAEQALDITLDHYEEVEVDGEMWESQNILLHVRAALAKARST